ncbi:MAG: hypothetical protein Q7T66_00600 [Herminiimonas sp.]|uniref:hypothetical protein n=1 Tax=Herminiimonas sp. TaxID=1926289 RepID=UPI0027260E3E|nr:hypothetical protein [Herminiimonas sp.]MDO9419136.1 hypothetical protein [Herminiimonas sp.]
MKTDFQEISHSGGIITFYIKTTIEGNKGYSVGIRGSRPVPMVWIQVYALPQGIVVEALPIVGMGVAQNSPTIPGSLPVFICSDSEGKFGHNCPSCDGYWRSGPWPNICPYCGLLAPCHDFLSHAQKRYVKHYCEVLHTALCEHENAELQIDMDSVADAAGTDRDKPAFYVSEESQQHKFICNSCGEFNDVLGKYGYCSLCGTRVDLSDFELATIHEIRTRLNGGSSPETCIRDAVSAFDSFLSQYAKQLANLVPMTASRKLRLTTKRFHNLTEVLKIFSQWFDIDLVAKIKESDVQFLTLKFHRRHIYEHNGGEVDSVYLAKSGDQSVRLKEVIYENKEDVHKTLDLLMRIANNAHDGFHAIFQPNPEPIAAYKRARI